MAERFYQPERSLKGERAGEQAFLIDRNRAVSAVSYALADFSYSHFGLVIAR